MCIIKVSKVETQKHGGNEMDYRERIEQDKKEWIGKTVRFDGNTYTVVDVDYNGALMIDKPARFTETTAVGSWMVEVV